MCGRLIRLSSCDNAVLDRDVRLDAKHDITRQRITRHDRPQHLHSCR